MVPVFEEYKRKLFPYGSQDTLASITGLGYVLFLFETGIKMDFHTIMRTGRKAWVITFFGLVTPIIFGFATRNVKIMDYFSNSPLEANIIMVGHNTTSFAVIVALLNDLELLNSELGRLALSVSLIGDLLSNIVVTMSSTMVSSSSHIPFGVRLGSLVGIAIFILFIYRPTMLWIVEHTPEGKEVKDTYVNIVIGILFACFICSLYFNMPPKDAISLSLLLNCKGVVEVTMYSTALDRNDILSKTYCVIILIIMVSICTTHLLVKRLYDPSRKYAGYQKRNLFNLKHHSELKILVVIHKQHHVTPITEVIDLCHPIVEHPITVDALHLIELVGRSSPIFISHKKKKVVSLNLHDSYSDSVVLNLKLYEHDKEGAAIINPYTAISPLNLMHEDVCHLAFDKLSSIIILPFHKKWLSDGKLEYDDINIRSLNCSVLEKSPCSVGILVTRGIRLTDSIFRLALVFLGGRDDREALCLANRAAQDPSVELVVYHIVDKKRTLQDMENLETRFDIAMLKDGKISHYGFENVEYKEIEVEGGSQTIDVLRQMVEEHDFIIVGRRQGIKCPQTSGLQEWSEFPELGPVGDFLASSDLDCKASVLVVQQQQQICM
ncbi:hypothetical protein TSUD_318060 [Trifolium subterraneum]|nr:hypothetical protein TSUD_318060 [Trifolium subterraneum]